MTISPVSTTNHTAAATRARDEAASAPKPAAPTTKALAQDSVHLSSKADPDHDGD
jgi:hypothetical protein